MADLGFANLLAVAAIAFGAPLLLGLAPALRVPAVVLEIVLGIVVGPTGLGWVSVDPAVEALALVGLAFLLFLAGLEVQLERLRGRVLRIALASFAVSFVVAVGAGLALYAAGLVRSPLLVAIILSATSLGIVIPLLKDAGETGTRFGQLVIAASSIADIATIVLLSLLFSREAKGTVGQLVLLGSFAGLAVAIGVAVRQAERSRRLSRVLARLQDTTAQIRVRGAFALVVGFAALAEALGLEVILGAFAAGAVLTLVDRDQEMTHPDLRLKLEAVGFGVFVPVFFVTSGLRFDLSALFASASTVARVPLFLLALLAARGLPAVLYRRLVGDRRSVAAGLLQATSLPFIVTASAIGRALGLLTSASAAGLVAAGLLSVLIFPLLASSLIAGASPSREPGPAVAPVPSTPSPEAAP